MSSQDLYNEAKHLLNGTGGYPKDEKKGYKKMKEAADAGNTEACVQYANYLCGKQKYFDALNYFESNDAYTSAAREYVTCLYNCALKKASDPTLVENYYNKACRVKDKLRSDGCYYFAQLAKMSGQSDDVYRKALYFAALGDSEAMPDQEYALIGRERGVIYGKSEIEAHINANYAGSDAKYFGGFLPCTQTEQSAWNIAKANLTNRKVKKEFGAAAAHALAKAEPKGILEYQPVAYSSSTVGTVSFRYEYDNPNYTTVTKGSSALALDYRWFNYHASFRSKYRQGEFHKQFEKATFTKTTPDARMRTISPRFPEVLESSVNMAKTSATNGSRKKLKTALAAKNNWESQYVTVDFDNNGQSLEIKTYCVPFWFFTKNLGLGKSVTARVNGATGEVEFFQNNPFGLFTPFDDVKIGAYLTYSKERQKEIKKAMPAYKKRKKHLIALLVQCALLVLSFAIKFTFLSVLVILSLLVHGALWFVPKATFQKLLSKLKGALTKKKASKSAEEPTTNKETATKTTETEPKKETATKKEAVSATDTDDNDDIVTLKGQNGEDIDFIEIAGIAYNGNFYAILQPVELLEGMDDDEALVFKVTKGANGDDRFEIELDDATIDAVFAEYDKLLAEANNN